MEMLPASVLKLEEEFSSLESRLSQPSLSSDLLKSLSARYNELRPLVLKIKEITAAYREIRDLEEIVQGAGVDKELVELAVREKDAWSCKVEKIQAELLEALKPKDPNDSKNVFLEVRAGAGGDEAALFASELLRMYGHFAQDQGFRVEMMEANATGLKGIKSAVLYISGGPVYGWLKYEGGVHRVQRVPQTEASGRIHTSTVTVAVMPEVEEVDVDIRPEDLRVDTYRAGGARGENVKKVETAIRITHLPTGVVVQCQDERSQLKNKMKAMAMLRSKLYEAERQKQEEKTSQTRKVQVGTGDR
jgi:peptide chain release factor 1